MRRTRSTRRGGEAVAGTWTLLIQSQTCWRVVWLAEVAGRRVALIGPKQYPNCREVDETDESKRAADRLDGNKLRGNVTAFVTDVTGAPFMHDNGHGRSRAGVVSFVVSFVRLPT